MRKRNVRVSVILLAMAWMVAAAPLAQAARKIVEFTVPACQ
jgi:hypothetical protein